MLMVARRLASIYALLLNVAFSRFGFRESAPNWLVCCDVSSVFLMRSFARTWKATLRKHWCNFALCLWGNDRGV